MFGRSIKETVELEKKFGGGGYVPYIVHRCCDYVKRHGTYVCMAHPPMYVYDVHVHVQGFI